MNRIALSSLAIAVVVSACAAPRSISLPVTTQTAPASSTIEVSGSKFRTRVFDVEIPRVELGKRRGFALKLGPVTVNKNRTTQERKFSIERGGAPIATDVNCMSVNQEQREGLLVYSRHTYTCSSQSGFELAIDQQNEAVFSGKAKLGHVDLEVISTIEFTDGKKGWSPSGFHVRRDGRWLGTFEYFKQGKAYLAPDLSPEEHDAVLAAVVTISSTGRWFQLNPDGTSGKRYGF